MVNKKYHILREVANGVMDEKGRFFPFKYSQATLPAKNSVRYYIKNIVQQFAGTAAVVAATACYVAASWNKEALTLAYFTVPQTTAAVFGNGTQEFQIQVLLDLDTAVTVTPGGTTPTATNMIYAEIDENQGEYI